MTKLKFSCHDDLITTDREEVTFVLELAKDFIDRPGVPFVCLDDDSHISLELESDNYVLSLKGKQDE